MISLYITTAFTTWLSRGFLTAMITIGGMAESYLYLLLNSECNCQTCRLITKASNGFQEVLRVFVLILPLNQPIGPIFVFVSWFYRRSSSILRILLSRVLYSGSTLHATLLYQCVTLKSMCEYRIALTAIINCRQWLKLKLQSL